MKRQSKNISNRINYVPPKKLQEGEVVDTNIKEKPLSDLMEVSEDEMQRDSLLDDPLDFGD